MKNRKLNLDELKVKSFVTSFDKKTSETLKGGYLWSWLLCPSKEEDAAQ